MLEGARVITAVYPGSFDPVTLGHMDIIERSSKIFDKVIVCVMNNASKKTSLFSHDERVNMLKDVVSELDNVYVDSYQGMLVDYVKAQNAEVIIRGLRGATDAGPEIQMAQGIHQVSPDIDTMFLATDPKLSFISSSMVREIASYGTSVECLVPKAVLPYIEEKVKNSL